MEWLQPTGNNDHAKFRLTASKPPASNEELHDNRHLPEPTHHHLFRVLQSYQGIKSKSNLYHLWSIPSCGMHLCAKTREKEFVMAIENGAAVAQPNLHQRALCQAKTI